MKIGVYGLGRFGMFWAKMFAAHERFEVLGYNRTPKPAEEIPEGIQIVPLEELCRADALFLCVAISSVEQVLRNIAGLVPEGTCVMDTCSVKVYPSRLMRELLPEGVRIIATHPMFGPDSGRYGVAGLPLVFSPQRCDEQTNKRWERIFSDLFALNVIQMSAEEHDREAAFTQGITHFVGRVLGELELKSSDMATEGYKGLLHIIEQTCNDPMSLFFDLQRYNPYTRDMHVKLQASIDDVMERLRQADSF
jgi:prephenate dehydrogenase